MEFINFYKVILLAHRSSSRFIMISVSFLKSYFCRQAEAIPPHLLRQYIGDQGSPAQTQVIPRATQVVGASPSAARFVRISNGTLYPVIQIFYPLP